LRSGKRAFDRGVEKISGIRILKRKGYRKSEFISSYTEENRIESPISD
jgi:hypothetical protein